MAEQRLIDANALIKDIDYSADMGGALGKVVECVKYYAKYMVASAPTIEERKKGKWIRITQGAMPEKYMCPFCHRTVEHEGTEYFVSMMYPFCHCGADMRGEEDGSICVFTD